MIARILIAIVGVIAILGAVIVITGTDKKYAAQVAAIAATNTTRFDENFESLPQRIEALIRGYKEEREADRKAHRKTVEELGSYIVNLLVELRTNNVAIDRWPMSTNWQLNITQVPDNTNRMVVRYME